MDDDRTQPAPARRPLWPRIRRVWATLGIAATVLFVGWSLLAYRASPEAHAALASDAAVTVTREPGSWRFRPARLDSGAGAPAGLIFFAGALVDPVAYAPLARAVAAAGFEVVLIGLPRRGAFGGADDPALFERARAVLREAGEPARWAVAGHSRGAVAAVQLADDRPDGMSGLVLVGTSHPRDVSLTSLRIPVTKIVGTRDGLAGPEEVRANQHLLPKHTRWVWVEGGNHSQFGWYGFQPGDRRAAIPAAAQRDAMTRAVLGLLREVAGPPPR